MFSAGTVRSIVLTCMLSAENESALELPSSPVFFVDEVPFKTFPCMLSTGEESSFELNH